MTKVVLQSGKIFVCKPYNTTMKWKMEENLCHPYCHSCRASCVWTRSILTNENPDKEILDLYWWRASKVATAAALPAAWAWSILTNENRDMEILGCHWWALFKVAQNWPTSALHTPGICLHIGVCPSVRVVNVNCAFSCKLSFFHVNFGALSLRGVAEKQAQNYVSEQCLSVSETNEGFEASDSILVEL